MAKKKVVKEKGRKETPQEMAKKVDPNAPNHPVTERYGEKMGPKYGGAE